MAYQFYLDGTLVNNPGGELELDALIKRDANLGGFLITQDAELQFTGDAYTYLYNKLYQESYCSEVAVLILESCSGSSSFEIHKGIIKISDISADFEKCIIKTKVLDNSFYSYINNNKAVEVTLTSTKTKTGEDITPPPLYQVTMFQPASGNTIATPCMMYRLTDVFEFICLWASDNKVGYRSDYLADEATEIFITTGQAIRLLGQPPEGLKIPFGKLREEIYKKRNISFFIESSVSPPAVLRMENAEYFFKQNPVASFTDILDMKGGTIIEKLYGTVSVGSEKTLTGNAFAFPEGTSYTGYKIETFQTKGQCNVDRELNLVSSYVISSNVIEDQIFAGVENDESIFMIACDTIDTTALTAAAIATPFGSGAIYNQFLNNKNTVDRFYGYIHADIFDFFGTDTNEFQAGTGTDEAYTTQVNGLQTGWTNVPQAGATIDPYPFPDETTAPNFDGSLNYDNALFEYTCPSTGDYSFAMGLQTTGEKLGSANYALSCPGAIAGQGIYYCRVILTIENQTTGQTQVFTKYKVDNNPELIAVTAILNCSAGDTVNCRASFQFRIFPVIDYSDPLNPVFFNYTFPQNSIWSNCMQTSGQYRSILIHQDGSYFAATGTPESGIEVASNPPDIYKTYRYEFELPLTGDEYRTLIADPTGLFTFTHRGITRTGWIEEVKYQNWEQRARIKMVTYNSGIGPS